MLVALERWSMRVRLSPPLSMDYLVNHSLEAVSDLIVQQQLAHWWIAWWEETLRVGCSGAKEVYDGGLSSRLQVQAGRRRFQRTANLSNQHCAPRESRHSARDR